MSSPVSTIGDRLREERKRLGLSQTALAKVAGVHLNTQSRYEKGHTEPDSAYLEAIGRAGVDVLYVLSGLARGVSEEEARQPNVAAIITGKSGLVGDYFGCDFFLEALDITRSDWEDVVRRNLRRWPLDRRADTIVPGVFVHPCSPWGPDIARASHVVSCLLEGAATLDSALLAEVLGGVDMLLTEQGRAIEPAKKAQTVAMLYRAFKVRGKIDSALIEEAVKLAAS